MWVGTLNLRIVAVYELLDCLEGSVAELVGCFRVNLLDLLKVIDSNVLVSIGLEDISGYFTTFKTWCVNKVTVFTSRASIGPMVVATGHGAEITWFDELILLQDGLMSRHLIELSQLHSSLLVQLLKLDDLLVGDRDEDLRRLAGRLL